MANCPHAKAIAFARNGQFGSKIKIVKNMRKNHYTATLELFGAKNGLRKHLMFEKWQILELKWAKLATMQRL